MNIETTTPSATWVLDCQGKQDFDAITVRLDVRYRPSRDYTRIGGKITKPSAKANFDFISKSNCTTLVEREFEADTEAEVKTQVEAWTASEHKRIFLKLMELYQPITPSQTKTYGTR